MPTIWSVRAFRLWFVFALPAATVLAGWLVAITATRVEAIQELQTLLSAAEKSSLDQVNSYSAIMELAEEERRSKLDLGAYIPGSAGSLKLAQLNKQVEFSRRQKEEQDEPLRRPERTLSRSLNEASSALLGLLAVLVSPIIIIGAKSIIAWVWYRPPASAATRVQATSTDSSLLAQYTRLYLCIAGTLSTSALLLFFFPQHAMKALVSGVVQAVVGAVSVWVLVKIYRRFQRDYASQETRAK